MRRSSYQERDYVFGQAMLTLRTHIGMTQTRLANLLGVTRKAISRWEAGETYPSVTNLQAVLDLALRYQVFPPGQEEQEMRAFWRSAHQKVLMDEAWLQRVLHSHLFAAHPDAQHRLMKIDSTLGRRIDWVGAPAINAFYGRSAELTQLTSWITEERCRVVSVLGLGGIGKSALAAQVMHRAAEHFEVVIWRSLRDAPDCSVVLDECLQLIEPPQIHTFLTSPQGLERQLHVLRESMRRTRVLLVLDNLETLLTEGQSAGYLRSGYESYGRLFRQMTETEHQSCLLLTSREKLIDLVPQEGSRTSVRVLRLPQLDVEACIQLLAEKEVSGNISDLQRLITAYAGNPLALKVVAQTIVEVFGGSISLFLAQDTIIFGGVRDLLAGQFARLSTSEQNVLFWLAILREPVSFDELLYVQATPRPRGAMLEAVESLRRRSLIESGQTQHFTLQSVVLEFVTTQLIAEMAYEITHGQPTRLIEHCLTLARSSVYARQAQMRLIVLPLLLQLQNRYPLREELEQHLQSLLQEFRIRVDTRQGYGPTNVLMLLQAQRGHLRSLDLSRLALREAYLQEIEMQDTTIADAMVQDCAWMLTFGAIWSVAVSHDGRYRAAGSRRGEMWVWEQRTLHRSWLAHADVVRALAFSPDDRHLASVSYDGRIKVWDIPRGTLLWAGSHTNYISGLAYSPDGSMLASGGTDATVRLWNAQTGAAFEVLTHPQAIFSVAWSPVEDLLASFGLDGQIRLWKVQQHEPARCVAVLAGHTHWGMGLAFSPDGHMLASASWDKTLKLWDLASRNLVQTLTGNTDRVQTVAWSPDGRTLASAAFDHLISLWDVEQRTCRAVLSGHSSVIFSLAFLPGSSHMLSGSTDGTLRVWNTKNGQCEQMLQGYAISLYDITWHPEGHLLASGASDGQVTIWDVEKQVQPPLFRQLQGHQHLVFGVAWSPDGRLLASSGWDNRIQLWDATANVNVQTLSDPSDPYTSFYGLAWSPDGQYLACGSTRQAIQVWQVSTATLQWSSNPQTTTARRVAWSPDGSSLASAGDDGIVSVWNAFDGYVLRQLPGHQGKVNDVAWSLDGRWLASGGGSSDTGEALLWDMRTDEKEARAHMRAAQTTTVYAVAWSPDSSILITGEGDGMLRWWNRQSGVCLRTQRAHQGTIQRLQVSSDGTLLASCGDDGAIHLWNLECGEPIRTLRLDRPYERLNISGVTGLTQAQRASLFALGAIEQFSEK